MAHSMRPRDTPPEGKIVRIGQSAARRGILGLEHLVGDGVALAIGDRFLLGMEAQPHLLLHVGRAGPAHQRLDLARLLRLVIEHPFPDVGGAGLHRGSCRLVDAGNHGFGSTSSRPRLVGAAGFEPATWSTQNSRATRLRYAPPNLARTAGSIHASPRASKAGP